MSIDVPPPPVFIPGEAPSEYRTVAMIRAYAAGPVSCSGQVVMPELRVDPVPDGLVVPSPSPAAEQPSLAAASLSFDIAADGRPVSIRRLPPFPPLYGMAMADDVEPALAAWRFAAGAPRRHCSIAVEVRDVPVEQAEAQLLYLYLSTRGSNLFRYAPSEVYDSALARIRPVGATCPRQPGARIWVWPDFDKIAAPAGTIAWDYFGFDVDSRGKALRLRLLGSSGNADLDRRAVAALRQSVFTRPATGCTYNFFRGPATRTPPPPGPESMAAYRAEAATCDRPPAPAPASSEGGWSQMAPLEFPENFARRGLQGWAVVRYDVAPWGQTGNVRVVESQPASGFGEAAKSIVQRSTRKPGPYGYTNCLETIRFKLPPREGEKE